MLPDNHFNKLYWFCVGTVATGLTFLIILCFVPVPKGNERFADNVQGYMEGSVVTAAMAFLLGGSIPLKRSSDQPAGTTKADITASITTEPTKEKEPEEKANVSD